MPSKTESYATRFIEFFKRIPGWVKSAWNAFKNLFTKSDSQGVNLQQQSKHGETPEENDHQETQANKEEQLAQQQVKRDQERLESAKKETELARQEAEAAKQEAQLAKEQVESAKQETELARKEAETAKQEAQLAKEQVGPAKQEVELTSSTPPKTFKELFEKINKEMVSLQDWTPPQVQTQQGMKTSKDLIEIVEKEKQKFVESEAIVQTHLPLLSPTIQNHLMRDLGDSIQGLLDFKDSPNGSNYEIFLYRSNHLKNVLNLAKAVAQAHDNLSKAEKLSPEQSSGIKNDMDTLRQKLKQIFDEEHVFMQEEQLKEALDSLSSPIMNQLDIIETQAWRAEEQAQIERQKAQQAKAEEIPIESEKLEDKVPLNPLPSTSSEATIPEAEGDSSAQLNTSAPTPMNEQPEPKFESKLPLSSKQEKALTPDKIIKRATALQKAEISEFFTPKEKEFLAQKIKLAQSEADEALNELDQLCANIEGFFQTQLKSVLDPMIDTTITEASNIKLDNMTFHPLQDSLGILKYTKKKHSLMTKISERLGNLYNALSDTLINAALHSKDAHESNIAEEVLKKNITDTQDLVNTWFEILDSKPFNTENMDFRLHLLLLNSVTIKAQIFSIASSSIEKQKPLYGLMMEQRFTIREILQKPDEHNVAPNVSSSPTSEKIQELSQKLDPNAPPAIIASVSSPTEIRQNNPVQTFPTEAVLKERAKAVLKKADDFANEWWKNPDRDSNDHSIRPFFQQMDQTRDLIPKDSLSREELNTLEQCISQLSTKLEIFEKDISQKNANKPK